MTTGKNEFYSGSSDFSYIDFPNWEWKQKSDETIKKENTSLVSLTYCIFISVNNDFLLEINHH